RWLSLSKPLGRAPSRPSETNAETRILERWDRRRAAAYSRGCVPPPRRQYAPGSNAGVRDVRTLQSYAARGLVVTGMRMRLLSVDVVHESRHRLVLRVRD